MDEQGREYTPTYSKRAKGLIKHGRARWLGEDAICLTCPPEHFWEDATMEETVINPAVQKPEMAYILERLDKVIDSNHYTLDALNTLKGTNDATAGVGTKAWAIANTVEAREQTNREIIAFLQKMYTDLTRPAACPDNPVTFREFMDSLVNTKGMQTETAWDSMAKHFIKQE